MNFWKFFGLAQKKSVNHVIDYINNTFFHRFDWLGTSFQGWTGHRSDIGRRDLLHKSDLQTQLKFKIKYTLGESFLKRSSVHFRKNSDVDHLNI
jgi:hypothetical protein